MITLCFLILPLVTKLLLFSCFPAAGGDFVAVQETLSFPSNSVPGTQRCVNISIIDDSVIEGPQEFGLVLSVPPESQGVTFSGANTTVTILDNDCEFLHSSFLTTLL